MRSGANKVMSGSGQCLDQFPRFNCVIIHKDANGDGKGEPHHQDRAQALGSQARAQKSTKSKPVLESLISQLSAAMSFASHSPDQKLQPWVLESEMGRRRESLPVLRLKSIRTLDFTLYARRFWPRRESTRTPLRCSTSPGTTSSARCVMSTLGRSRSAGRSESIRKEVGVADRSFRKEAVECGAIQKRFD